MQAPVSQILINLESLTLLFCGALVQKHSETMQALSVTRAAAPESGHPCKQA